MPGRGFAPSGNRVRERDNKKQIQLVADGKTRGPALPKIRDKKGQDVAWHPMTRRWWNNWRKSPQALRMMTGPDWDFLLDTALMHHQMWEYGRWELAAEVRLRVQKFGATPEDRARLGIEVGSPRPGGTDSLEAGSATVTSIDSARQDRLLADGDD